MIYTVRIVGIFITAFGIACSLAGIELGNLWAISDLGNILIVFANIPLLYLGAKCVFRATAHFKKKDGTPFTSSVIGRSCPYWDERAGKATDKKQIPPDNPQPRQKGPASITGTEAQDNA